MMILAQFYTQSGFNWHLDQTDDGMYFVKRNSYTFHSSDDLGLITSKFYGIKKLLTKDNQVVKGGE